MKALSAGRCDSLTIAAVGLTVLATACAMYDTDPPPFTLQVSPESVSTPAGSRIGTTIIATRTAGAPFPIWVNDVTPSGIHSVLPVAVGRGNSTPAEYVVDDSVAPGPRVVAFSAYAIEQPLGTKVVIERATLTINVTPFLGRFQLARAVPPTPPPCRAARALRSSWSSCARRRSTVPCRSPLRHRFAEWRSRWIRRPFPPKRSAPE